MADGPVVTNTSPLIKLVGVGLLDILPAIYGEIWIPEIVYQEYQAGMSSNDPHLDALSWAKIIPLAIEPSLMAIRGLGVGEAAAISLATLHHARAVLLDDLLGRRTATSRGLPVVGTLAVLLRAKREGLIQEVRPFLDTMISQGRRISQQLRAQILQDAGEDSI